MPMTVAGVALIVALLAALVALIAAPIVLALFIAGAVVRLVFFVVFLPFRLLLRSLFLFGGIAFLLLLGLLPVLPFVLIGAGLYLIFRTMRRPAAPVGRA